MTKQDFLVLFVVALVGLSFVGAMNVMVSGATAEARDSAWHQFNFYPDQHHHHDIDWNPELDINHSIGRPGSYFWVAGNGYPAYEDAYVWVNGRSIGNAYVDSTGDISFELTTDNADDGVYYVTVKVYYYNAQGVAAVETLSATERFEIDSNYSTTWQSEGIPKTFDVPASIAFTEFVYLPLVSRDG
jgi:hypothetical protein